MNIQSPTCPNCQDLDYVRIFYGYPDRNEWPNPCLYGGIEIGHDSPTHFWDACGLSFIVKPCEHIYFPSLENCHFCGDAMSAKDSFVFQNEFETWIGQGHDAFPLEAETFSDAPFPTCGKCREEILLAREGIEQDKQREAEMNAVILKLWLMLILVCLLGCPTLSGSSSS